MPEITTPAKKLRGEKSICLDAYKHMHGRCYAYPGKYPTYIDCTVCPEWRYYGNFLDWFSKNYITGYHLDKDILIKGNKVYSPLTCVFVPQEINKLFNNSKRTRSHLPQGVYEIHNPVLRYTVQISKYGRRTYLGSFNDLEKAKYCYKSEKEKHVKKVAKEQFEANRINEQTYNALLLWEHED